MKEENKHEPTPWILGGCSGRMITTPSGYYGDGFIADVDTKGNAEFIVRACNAHEEMLEALEWISNFCDNELDDPSSEIPLAHISLKAKAAIAKAQPLTK